MLISPVVPQVETARLRLRPLASTDLEDYAQQIFADAEVMRYLPRRDGSPHERAERTMAFFNDHWTHRGYGVWAVTDKADGAFVGHCGLNYLADTSEVEVLYALRRACLGSRLRDGSARKPVCSLDLNKRC